MSNSMVVFYLIVGIEAIGCGLLFMAATDLHDLSSRQLQGALNLYERLVAEIIAEIDGLATDIQLTDSQYAVLVSTVAAITDPANAGVVRRAVSENGLVLDHAFSEGAAAFELSLEELAPHPELRERYAAVVVRSVRAASLWDLALQGSRGPFLKIPAWATNPWRERDLIERSRYDESLVRDVLRRLGVVDRTSPPFRHAY